jgi:Mrp family chromosome partitioning ATPase
MPDRLESLHFLEYLRQGEIKRLIHRFSDEIAKRAVRSVAVTSLQPGEGRTFLVAVLAVGFAMFLKKRVLVVETCNQPEGGELRLDSVIGEASTGCSVDLITPKALGSGKTEAADFELKKVLDRHRDSYDLVIFDTAPVSSTQSNTMDAVIVARTAGNVIMLLSERSLAEGDFLRFRNEMREWGILIMGSVYNFGRAK